MYKNERCINFLIKGVNIEMKCAVISHERCEYIRMKDAFIFS